MPSGLTSTGYQIATLIEILTDIQNAELGDIDPALDLSPDQPIGQINGIVAKKISEAWELLQTAYGAFDDTVAGGSLLEALCALTGTFRVPAAKGSVTLNLSLNAGTVLPPTAMVASIADPSKRWVIDPLAAGYTAGGAGVYAVRFLAEKTGPTGESAGNISVIVTAVAGWTAATNPLDATPGTSLELDPDLRIRRRKELRGQGGSTLPALTSALLKVKGIISAQVIENVTNAPDGAGRPPHSFEAIVWDGVSPAAANLDIANVVWNNKPLGIQSVGGTTALLVDSYGITRSILFTRAGQVPITIAITVQTDPTKFPADGVARIQSAILAAGLLFTMGQEVVRLAIMALALAVPGVIDIPVCTLATDVLPAAAANVFPAATKIATFDSSRITVAVT